MLPTSNLLQLLQSGMSTSPLGIGPIPAQNPTPGFRAPAVGQMPTPGMRPTDTSAADAGMTGLAAALARMPGQGGQAAVNQARTANGGDMGGYSKVGAGQMFQLPDGTWVQNPNDPASYQQGGAPGGAGLIQQLRTALNLK